MELAVQDRGKITYNIYIIYNYIYLWWKTTYGYNTMTNGMYMGRFFNQSTKIRVWI